MTTAIGRWVQSHRYRVMVRQLRSLPSTELRALGIAPSQIDHLAFRASLAEHTKTHRTIVVLLAVFGLIALWGLD
jgi:uncharacterized protein YjiS (DUF1127 family)